MNDHESRDLAGAAYLAREADAYDVDRPSPSELEDGPGLQFAHGDVVVTVDADTEAPPAIVSIEAPGGAVDIGPDELRWLVHTGGPAALAALDRIP